MLRFCPEYDDNRNARGDFMGFCVRKPIKKIIGIILAVVGGVLILVAMPCWLWLVAAGVILVLIGLLLFNTRKC
jgi:hypothetical protein